MWERSHALTLSIYKATMGFPAAEVYGLVAQMRRGAVSIEANIAEGCGRGSDPELGRFLRIAAGSVNELDCHLQIARDLGFLPAEDHERLREEVHQVRRMLVSFERRVSSR